jgi:hypothetical protein
MNPKINETVERILAGEAIGKVLDEAVNIVINVEPEETEEVIDFECEPVPPVVIDPDVPIVIDGNAEGDEFVQ